MRQIEYLIIGQGLAGSCLALEFFKRGIGFLVIDNHAPNSASKVAAGLFNPITGRTNQPTWMASEIFKTLEDFYRIAEKQTGAKFFNPLPIYRPFLSLQEQRQWARPTARGNDNDTPPEIRAWITNMSSAARFPETINDPFGGIEINHSGFLNAQAFLASVKALLKQNGSLSNEFFNNEEMVVGETIQHKNIEAKAVIFCEGTEALTNPYFNWLPFIKLKGETLLIRAPLPTDILLNRGIFAVPTEQPNEFILGSTYHRDPTPGNSEKGIGELLANAKKLLKTAFETAAQNWGLRPTTIDRRPILGRHPTHQKILIFNGLGTKGVSLAPFFAVHLSDYLQGKTELIKEVNIERFYSLHFKGK
jgi:glycine oxidase